jgi:hypothetical protein
MDLVGLNALKPQTEEDIELIEWMNKAEFENKKSLFYPLIASLLTDYFSK